MKRKLKISEENEETSEIEEKSKKVKNNGKNYSIFAGFSHDFSGIFC